VEPYRHGGNFHRRRHAEEEVQVAQAQIPWKLQEASAPRQEKPLKPRRGESNRDVLAPMRSDEYLEKAMW
jgi:hypothetical protein